MRLRRSVRIKENSTIQRVSLQLDAAEIKHITGKEPEEHPRIVVRVEHGLLKVRAPHDGESLTNSFSMWRVKQRANPIWEAQLNVRLFPGIRLSAYNDITTVQTRKSSKELHAQLEQLDEGEEQSQPPMPRANTGRPRKAPDTASKAPEPHTARPATAAAEEPVSRLLPKEFVDNVRVSSVANTDGIAQEINSRYGLTDTDRSLLRAAIALINDQVRRGGIRPVIEDSGEVSIQVVKIRVETENL